MLKSPSHPETPPSAPPQTELDLSDRWLLNELQFDFPLQANPWAAIGRAKSIPAREILDQTIVLKKRGTIRQIGPIYDTRAMGYQSLLVAARVDERRIEDAAACIN